MASRLSVIMVHCPHPTAHDERTAEAVVGQLIGRNGFELTLVGPLAQLSDSSSDRLSLGSLSDDVVVLDWQSPQDTLAALHRIGLTGQRSRHAHDPAAALPSSGLRRIYAFDLTRLSDPGDLLDALDQLRSSTQVRTFTLSILPTSPSSSAAQRAEAPSSIASESSSTTGPGDAVPWRSRPLTGPAGTPQGPDSLDLDDLVDQLDQLDP